MQNSFELWCSVEINLEHSDEESLLREWPAELRRSGETDTNTVYIVFTV